MLKSLRTNNRSFTLKDKMHFGKYLGYSIKEIVESNPSYIRWCLENIEYFTVDDKVKKILNKRLVEEETKKAELRLEKCYNKSNSREEPRKDQQLLPIELSSNGDERDSMDETVDWYDSWTYGKE